VFLPPSPLRGNPKNQQFKKSPSGDLGVKRLFGVDSKFKV